MNPIAIGLIVLICVFSGALLGMFLLTVVPPHQLTEPSRDVVKLVTGVIATLAALVLGLLIASAKNSFDRVNEGYRDSLAKVVLLDRALAQYGPETKGLRELLRTSLAAWIEQRFPKDQSQTLTLKSAKVQATIEGLQQPLRALSPQSDAQRSIQSRALELSDAIAQVLWLGIEHQQNPIPTPLLAMLVFWLAVMFASFGLLAPRNAVTITVLFVGALSLSASISLLEALNNPLGSFIAISRGPADATLSQLGQ
jgi:hypothetical protein